MSKSEDLVKKLSQNIPPKIIERNTPMVVAPKEDMLPSNDKDIRDDYEFSRENYRKLVEKGTDAIDHCMELALQSDHPRAYEVLGGMLKNVSDMTDKLISLHGNLEKIKATNKPALNQSQTPAAVTNNNVFVGSTTELQRFIISQQHPRENIIDAKDVKD